MGEAGSDRALRVLLDSKGIEEGTLAEVEAQVTDEMDAAAEEALRSRGKIPPPEQALYTGFSEGGTLVGLEHRL
jgi:hypothetical protein